MTRSLHIIGNVQLDVLAGPVTALPRPGGDDVIDHIAVRPAGAAGNVSLALAALGVEHRLFGAVGDDQAGRWVADELRNAGRWPRDLHVVGGSGNRHLDRPRGARPGAGVPHGTRRSRRLRESDLPREASRPTWSCSPATSPCPAFAGRDAGAAAAGP